MQLTLILRSIQMEEEIVLLALEVWRDTGEGSLLGPGHQKGRMRTASTF